MSAKLQEGYRPAVQPQNLPKVSRFELLADGGYRLNPWEYAGMTFRIVGYDIELDAYSIKCIETGEYKEKDDGWLKQVTTKK